MQTLFASPLRIDGPSPSSARRRRSRIACLFVALALLSFAFPAAAQLMVSPTRIVLEGNQRAAQLEIINNSDKPTTFRIALVNRRMSESGEFSPAEAALPGEQFADAMLRYSPRRVTLAPGASQVIRVMAARPGGLAPGEYRSHLLFSEQPAPASRAVPVNPGTGAAPDSIGIALTALVGVSIPVIVRSGETSATVTFANVAMAAARGGTAPALGMDIRRSGNRSVYGDLVVSFTPTGGRARVVAQAAGVAVYVPNAVRHVTLAMPAAKLARGTLSVVFRARADEGGAIYAESMLALP